MKRVAILVLGGCDPRRLRENDGRRDDADGQVVTAGAEGMLDKGMMKDDQGQLGRLVGARAAMVGDGS